MIDADLSTAALYYAIELGWPVFLGRPGRKEPLIPNAHPVGDPARGRCRGECGRDGHGRHDATTDPDTILRWCRSSSPRANVAIATGSPGPDVVDVDCKDGRDGMATTERLRRAGLLNGPIALVQTPSGGLHLYYRGSQQGNGKLTRHGIDFRGRGGYVIAPPSVVNGSPYRLVERRDSGQGVDWAAIRRLVEPPPPPRPTTARPTTGSLDGLARWVARLGEGNRNDGLYWAACRAVEDGHANLDDLVTAACATGLPEHEARRTVASALGGQCG